MTILVTGASGFIGSELISHFRNEQVTGLVRTLSPKSSFDSVNWISFNLEDILNGQVVPGEYETVIHLAARAHFLRDINENSFAEFLRFNGEVSIELAKQMFYKGMKRFIFISSIGVNGVQTVKGTIFTECSDPKPVTDYGKSKFEAEESLRALSKELGFELVVVRPPLVYGSRAPGNFGLLTKLIQKLPVLPFGLAANKRDFISVQNLADFLITCAIHPNAAGHTFLVSDNETVSIKEFTNAIAKGLDKKVFQLPIPVSLMRLVGKLTGKSAMIEQLFGNLEVDSSNIKEVLGWTPPFTMEQAMASLKCSDK